MDDGSIKSTVREKLPTVPDEHARAIDSGIGEEGTID